MKFHRIVYILPLVLVCIMSGQQETVAQSFEDIKQQYQKDFNKFKKANEDKFNAYIEQIDGQFADYLKQTWQEYSLQEGVGHKTSSDPTKCPSYEPTVQRRSVKEITPCNPKAESGLSDSPKLPNVKKIEPDIFPTHEKIFPFYGQEMVVVYDTRIGQKYTDAVNEKGVSDYWLRMSKTNYNHLLDQLSAYKREFNLNDWGYYLLVRNFTQEIFPEEENSSRLLTWFLLTRSRYKTKIAFSSDCFFLMIPSNNTIIGYNYHSFDGQRFYLMDKPREKVYALDRDFPEADLVMDMNIYHPVNLGSEKGRKLLRFAAEEHTYSLEINYSLNAVNFYRDYPQTDIDIYFNSAVSRIAKESLVEKLKPLVESRSEVDAANLLLAFVQNAFPYKSDMKVHGRERFYFAEEMIGSDYSDCEDRSVLFAYLVKELLSLDIVGLEYPGHMATAIKFAHKVDGDHLAYRGDSYIIADPSYSNAPVGLCMPDVKGNPKVIDLSSFNKHITQRIAIRDFARKAGACRGDNKQDLVFNSKGEAYLTGYFIGKLDFAGFPLHSSNASKQCFLAKFDTKSNLLWARMAGGDDDCMGCRVVIDKQENPCISGCLKGSVSFGDNNITANGNSDLFLAKYTPGGDVIWAHKLGLDKLDHTVNFMFMSKYDVMGSKVMARLYNETEDFPHYGLSVDLNNNIYLTGSFYATTGINTSSFKYASATQFNAVSSLKTKNDDLIDKQYEKTIAGLFAVFQLLKVNRMQIPGESALKTFDKYNPGFKSHCNTVYKSIGGVTFMKNSGGVITIRSNDGKPIIFDKLKIKNNARVKVVQYKSGNARIEIFSGISIGKKVIWYDLNFVKLFKTSGELLLDYDDDHTQAKISVRRDLLKL